MEKHYKVVWTIDIWADDPVAAARKAQDLQQRPTTADYFKVSEFGIAGGLGEAIAVDLSEEQ